MGQRGGGPWRSELDTGICNLKILLDGAEAVDTLLEFIENFLAFD